MSIRISAPGPVRMPSGYTPPGTKRKLLTWSFADTRLRRAHNYWLATTRPDGRPHAAPVWGIWGEGAFVFSTDPSSRGSERSSRGPLRRIAALWQHGQDDDMRRRWSDAEEHRERIAAEQCAMDRAVDGRNRSGIA